MAVSYNTHHVVRFSSGEVWCFSYSHNQEIIIREMGSNGIWKLPYELIFDVHEDFSVEIDNNDHLHLMCRSRKGELLYLSYNGADWSKQVISVFEPALYTIRYPVVIPANNQIHVLFAVGKAFNTGYWSLQHYCLDNSEWNATEVTKITSGYRLSPFYTDVSDKYIHLAYRSLAANKYQIFYCKYHMDHNIWSSPENVTNDDNDCNMPSILVRDDILHLAWISLHKNDLSVKYKNRSVRSTGKNEWSSEIHLNSQGTNAALPRLIWAEGKIWCIWFQNDSLFGSCSEDQGKKWSNPAKLSGYQGPVFHYIHYSSNYKRDKNNFQMQWTFGHIKENLLLPLVNQYLDLPEYNPGTTATEHKKNTATDVISSASPSPVDMLASEFNRINEENKIILKCIKENTEMLQSLKKDMEQIMQDITLLKSKSWLRRILQKKN